MKKLLFAVLLVSFFACDEVDDDTGLQCTANCTHLEGRVFTKDGMPLKGVELVFQFKKPGGTNSHYIRKIGRAKTDASGFYSMDFFIEDEELGTDASGWFTIFAKESTIPTAVFSQNNFNLFGDIPSITNRDTTMVKNLYLPTPKNIEVRLENFEPIMEGDYFQVQIDYPVGFENNLPNSFGTFHNYDLYGINLYRAEATTNTFTLKAAENEINFIHVVKMKDGEYSDDVYPVIINANTPPLIYGY